MVRFGTKGCERILHKNVEILGYGDGSGPHKKG